MNDEVSLLTIHHAIKLSLMFNKTLSQIELRENKRNFQSKLNKSSQKLQVWTNGCVRFTFSNLTGNEFHFSADIAK